MKGKLHPGFRPPAVPPAGENGARVRELERCIEILGITLVATTPLPQRAALRRNLEERAAAAWSQSLPTAAGLLREIAAAVPPGEEPPF